ncbi:outer membrane biogenesis protein BamB [Planctomycetes bacterium MalM25]|nr:outer membrane biogenesis protein BamB [Planctomycetes bacterium MalM25]
MATAKQFLETLEIEKLVSNDVLDELYEAYRSSGNTMSAESMASRLVARGDLPREKADALVGTSSESFIQVGADSLVGKIDKKQDESPKNPFGDEEEGGEGDSDAGRRKHVKKVHKNDFDSPLLLIGGGALALLVLGGAALALMMNLQSGDQLIDSAKSAYSSGSYSQAREEYEQFVEDFTGHLRWSEARVSLGVVRLRQVVETSRDWDRALTIAQEELPQIEDEEAFKEANGEFASLLPRIARGLAEAADKESAAEDGGDKQKVDGLVARSNEALTLLSNTKYVPKSLRDDGDIAEIQELLTRVARRREAMADLNETLAAIDTATSSGQTADAYAAHASFLSRRPELRDDERLAERLASAVEAERQTIRFVEDAEEASRDERPSAIQMALPLANPTQSGRADAPGLFTRQFGGVLYAINAADGALLWRRPVGERLDETPATPLGSDLLVLDHRHGELLRVRSADGKLVWRVAVEEPGAGSALNQPVVAGDRVLVASESGRLWSFDATSGARLGYAPFAQPLRSAPAVNQEKGRVYVAGAQSSLYTLDAVSLECVAVRYTGHAKGAIPVAPVSLAGWLLTLENIGESTSRINVYSTDEQGVIANQLGDWRLEGVASTPIEIDGRKALVATESGATYLFELVEGREGQPLSLTASRTPESGPPHRRRAAVVRGGVWIAGEGLRRTAASPAESLLVARDLANPFEQDLFTGSIARVGDAVLHSRVRSGLPGLAVAANNARSGELVWETVLGAPPVAPPKVARSIGVVATTATGQTHQIGQATLRAGLSAAPATEPTLAKAFDGAAVLSDGRTVLTQTGQSQWVTNSLAPRATSRSVRLPGELACPPAVMATALVAPLRVGQVHLLDPTGKQLATPFQPRVEVGEAIDWTEPGVAQVAGQRLVALSDGMSTFYCLALQREGGPALAEAGSIKLDAQPTTRAAIATGHAAIGLASGSLAVAPVPSLGETASVELGSPITWGPYAAGESFLVNTEDGRLHAVTSNATPTVAWSIDLGEAEPLGAPLVADGVATLATADGVLHRLGLGDGAAAEPIVLGQSLGSAPTAYGKRLLVSAADGSVLVIQQP